MFLRVLTTDFKKMKKQSACFKSRGGGQFFKRLNADEVKVISLYDFNPMIERTRFSSNVIEALHCEPCDSEEFEWAEREVIRLLELPEFRPVA